MFLFLYYMAEWIILGKSFFFLTDFRIHLNNILFLCRERFRWWINIKFFDKNIFAIPILLFSSKLNGKTFREFDTFTLWQFIEFVFQFFFFLWSKENIFLRYWDTRAFFQEFFPKKIFSFNKIYFCNIKK